MSLVVHHTAASLALPHAHCFINNLHKNVVAIFIIYVEVIKLGIIMDTLGDQKFTTG